jgi:hypothetical protein
METSEVLAEGVSKVDSRVILGAEMDRIRPPVVQLLGAMVITPLWYLDPVS